MSLYIELQVFVLGDNENELNLSGVFPLGVISHPIPPPLGCSVSSLIYLPSSPFFPSNILLLPPLLLSSKFFFLFYNPHYSSHLLLLYSPLKFPDIVYLRGQPLKTKFVCTKKHTVGTFGATQRKLAPSIEGISIINFQGLSLVTAYLTL